MYEFNLLFLLLSQLIKLLLYRSHQLLLPLHSRLRAIHQR